MTVHGVDYTAGRLSAAQLRAADMEFAGRYIGRTTRLPAKFATKEEAADFDAYGIGLVLFYEDGAQRALGGAAAGRADAQFVAQQCAALGVPDHPVLYTVDFPATVEQIGGPIAEYFAAAAAVRGLPAVGCYGSYDTVRILLDRRLATYACQTPAWSGGRRDPRAQLYQGDPRTNTAEQTTVAGIRCDVLTALADDYGQGADMALSAEDLGNIEALIKKWSAFYSLRAAQVMVAGHSNKGYAPDQIPPFAESVAGQLRALVPVVAQAVAEVINPALDPAALDAAVRKALDGMPVLLDTDPAVGATEPTP